MSELNGKHDNRCLTHHNFNDFVREEWQPHKALISNGMERMATSIEKMAGAISLFAKLSFGLLSLLVLINGATQLVQMLKDSNTSLKGNIGSAALELHQEVQK